jgi:hypothetical protein
MSERMLFCLGDGKYATKGEGYQKNNRVFNVQVTPEEFDKIRASLPTIKVPLTKWIDKKDMTDEEKENSSVWKEVGGYLKVNTYENAWAIWWKEASQEDKNKILNCKYFNAEIFTKITGIKDFAVKSLSGKVVKVEIDGQKYEAVIK